MFTYRPDSELIYDYDEANQPHAVQSIEVNGIPAAGFYYDDNGNMTDGPDLTDPDSNMVRQLAWDADNMPISVDHSQHGTTTFLYDGNGRRVKKTSPREPPIISISTMRSLTEVGLCISGRGISASPSGRMGRGPQFFHKDHLGSSSFVTNEDGEKIESTEYLPFGGEREHNGIVASNYKFTDQEHDSSAGFYNYKARMYDPAIGQFISADPYFSANLTAHFYFNRVINEQANFANYNGSFEVNEFSRYFNNPLRLNRFAYVLGNPLNLIDFYGLMSEASKKAIEAIKNNPNITPGEKVKLIQNIPKNLPDAKVFKQIHEYPRSSEKRELPSSGKMWAVGKAAGGVGLVIVGAASTPEGAPLIAAGIAVAADGGASCIAEFGLNGDTSNVPPTFLHIAADIAEGVANTNNDTSDKPEE